MIAWLKAWWERHIVRDMTPAEEACETCREECDEVKAKNCQWHLAIAAAKGKPSGGKDAA